MRPFEYIAPASLEEAARLLGPGTRALAGGTDLVTLMKPELEAPQRLVAVRRLLPARVVAAPTGLELGAAVTLGELAAHGALRTRYTALAEAAEAAASTQLRNMATLGGNLLQRPRCWYFRDPEVHCWLKGGSECPARDGENAHHALFGDSPCVAVHPSDPAAALLALDAQVVLRGRKGERAVPLEKFFALPNDQRRTETKLADDELVVSVRIAAPQAGARSTYLKAMERGTFSFALAGAAVVLGPARDRAQRHARVVLAGVAPVPWRAREAEAVLQDGPLDAARIERAAQAALEGAAPLAHNRYKVPLATALVRRALQSLTADWLNEGGRHESE